MIVVARDQHESVHVAIRKYAIAGNLSMIVDGGSVCQLEARATGTKVFKSIRWPSSQRKACESGGNWNCAPDPPTI
jgi:hypothetical protein